MAYSKSFQSTVETLGTMLQEPTGIAILASVGFHGILWLFLPLLPITPFEPKEPDIRGAVQILELTPDEMKRLPDLPDTQTAQLPQSPSTLNGSRPFQLQPMPNPFSSQLPIPLPPAPRFQPPSNLFVPPLLPSFPPRSTIARPPAQRPQATRPVFPEFPSNMLEPGIDPSTPASPTTRATPTPSPTPGQPPVSMEQLVAQQRELLTYSAEGTTQQSAMERYAPWFGEAIKLLGEDWDAENAKPLDIVAPYPRVACPSKLEGTTVIGAVVGEDGKLLEALPPIQIQSSGYPLFNQLAMDLVNRYEFEATEKKQVYRMNVEFKFNADTCPAAFLRSPAPADQ